MDNQLINQCTALSLAGKLTFSEIVERLLVSGIERYIVDLVGQQKISYNGKGESYNGSFTFEFFKVSEYFSVTQLKSAILDIQQQKIGYKKFLQLIMEAGCCHYEVYITGKKAIYFGRDGSHHIEKFP